MNEPRPDEAGQEGSWLLFLLGLALLISPVLLLWSAPGQPWWLIFWVWGCLIAGIAWLNRRRG